MIQEMDGAQFSHNHFIWMHGLMKLVTLQVIPMESKSNPCDAATDVENISQPHLTMQQKLNWAQLL